MPVDLFAGLHLSTYQNTNATISKNARKALLPAKPNAKPTVVQTTKVTNESMALPLQKNKNENQTLADESISLVNTANAKKSGKNFSISANLKSITITKSSKDGYYLEKTIPLNVKGEILNARTGTAFSSDRERMLSNVNYLLSQ